MKPLKSILITLAIFAIALLAALASSQAATFDTFVIAASDQPAANTFWADAGAGTGTFTTALVPYPGPADATATNYIATGQFRKFYPVQTDNFLFAFPTCVNFAYTGTVPGNNAYIASWLANHGLQRQVINTNP